MSLHPSGSQRAPVEPADDMSAVHGMPPPMADVPPPEEPRRRDVRRWWAGASPNLRSSLILLVSVFAFTLMTVLIKVSGQRIPLVEILTVRQLVMQALIIPFSMASLPRLLHTRRPMLQVFRGLLQLGAMGASFTAVIHLPLAHAMSISFSYAIFVTLGAGLFLKEKVGLGRWIAAGIGLVGVFVMLRPSGDASMAYSLVAVLGAMFAAASAVSLRIHPEAGDTFTVLTYQALVLLAAFSIPTALAWVTPTFGELVILLLIGVSGTVGQWTLTFAYQKGEAAALAPLDFVRLLLTTLCGLVFFHEHVDIWLGTGAALVVGATAYTFHRNAKRARERLARAKLTP